MSQEKAPRKAVAKKGVTKKAAERAVPATAVTSAPLAAAPIAAVPVAEAPVAKARARSAQAKPRANGKSLQVNIEDIIRLRAYEIYLRRGATPGNPHEDWNVAEREVRAHFGQEADAQESPEA